MLSTLSRSSVIHKPILLVSVLLLAQGALAGQEAISIEKIDRKDPVLFQNEILPMLRSNCVACHSSTKARGDINLESVKAILEGGEDGPIVVPGKSGESTLLKAAAHQAKPIMPPKKNKVGARPLTSKELGLIALWIDQGAKSGGTSSSSVAVEWHPLPVGHNPIYATAVRFDGKIAACARANQIFLYELDSGGEITRLTDPALVEAGPYKRPGIAHLDSVQSLAFSPDGETLASGGFRCVKIWKHRKGVSLAEFEAGPASVACLDVSLAAGVLATGHEDGKVRVQKTSGELLGEIPAASDPIISLSLAMDGKSLCALSKAGKLDFWSVEGLKKTGSIALPPGATAVTYLAKDANVATGGEDGLVLLWAIPGADAPAVEAKEGEEAPPSPAPIKELKGHAKRITCVVSVDRAGGQLLSGSEDGTVRLWDAPGGKQVREFKHGSPVRSAVVRKDGARIAVAGDAPVVTLWNLADGKEVAKLQDDPALRWTTARKERYLKLLEGRLASQKKSREGDVKNLEGKKKAQKKNMENLAKVKKARDEKNKALEAIKAEDKKKVDMADKEAKASQAALELATKVSQEKDAALAAVKNAPDKAKVDLAESEAKAAKTTLDEAAKASEGKSRTLEEARKGEDKEKIKLAESEAKAATEAVAKASSVSDKKNKATEVAKKSRDKKKIEMAAKEAKDAKGAIAKATKARNDKNKALEAAKKGGDKKKFEKADKEAKTAQSSVDSAERTLVESGKDIKKAEDQLKSRDEEIKKAEARAVAPGEQVAAAKAAEAAARKPSAGVAFSADGNYLYTLGQEKTMVAWSSETGAGLHSFKAEGRILAATEEGVVFCRGKSSMRHIAPIGQWELDKTLGSPTGESPLVDRILSIDFSPDGKRLAAGGGETSRTGELSVWDLEKGELVWRLEDAHSDTVFAVDYSAEGEYIATGGADKFARSFKAVDGERVRFYEGHTAHVLGVSWQSDGNILASCGADNVIKIWDFHSGEVKRTIGGFSKQVSAVSFIGDSQETLSCSGDKKVKMHRANDGNNFRSFAGAGDYMYSIGVTPDAAVVVAGGYDSVLHVWNGKDAKARHQLKPPEK